MYTLLFVVLFLQTISVNGVNASVDGTDTFESFVQKVLMNHESLNLAKLDILRTKSEIQVIESSLGWNLFADAGINRNRSFFGAETTQSSLSLGVNKIFQSGDSIQVKSHYVRDDSEYAIIKSQANPLSTTGVDLDYRIPLMQNKVNREFLLNKNSANSKYTESINIQSVIRDEITSQAIELFYSSAILTARLKTAKQSIERAQKLKNHIRNNIKLGILEKGEILQSNAQIYNLQGQYQELKLVWEQSEIAINRLIGKLWNSPFIPIVITTPLMNYDYSQANDNVKIYNPVLKSLNLNLKLADSIIAFHRDNTRSKLDLVISIGTQNTQGPSGIGDINYTDVIGGIKLEYQKALDGRGLNTRLYQAQIDKDRIKTQIVKLEKDLKFDTHLLISNINRISKVNSRYEERHEVEVEKYKDIVKRYRAGRATTNIVIQFENERTQAELVYKTQNILREKTISLLKLKQGKLLTKKLHEYKVDK